MIGLSKYRKKIVGAIKNLTAHTSVTIHAKYFFYYSDPQKTALLYGIMNSVKFNLDFLLCKYFKTHTSEILLFPDFEKQENNIDISMKLSVKIINVCIVLFKLLPIIIKYKKNIKKEGGAINGSSNRRLDENYNG
jgi:hypothetical protein